MHKEHETQEKKSTRNVKHKKNKILKHNKGKIVGPSYSLASFCKRAKSFFMKLLLVSNWC
jgi:hypothetical protein